MELHCTGGEPNLQSSESVFEEGEVIGKFKTGMYSTVLRASIIGSTDPFFAKRMEVG